MFGSRVGFSWSGWYGGSQVKTVTKPARNTPTQHPRRNHIITAICAQHNCFKRLCEQGLAVNYRNIVLSHSLLT